MLQPLIKFVHSRWYWLAVILTGISLECVALFYQYVLQEPPCALCIHARAWVLLGVVFAFAGLILQRFSVARIIAQIGLLISIACLWNRSLLTVLVERGEYETSCGLNAGFPAWLPLDRALPQVFEPWTFCGYTPNFILGMSMGEGLLYGAIALFVIAVLALIAMIWQLLAKA